MDLFQFNKKIAISNVQISTTTWLHLIG